MAGKKSNNMGPVCHADGVYFILKIIGCHGRRLSRKHMDRSVDFSKDHPASTVGGQLEGYIPETER